MSWQRVRRIAGREILTTLLLLFLCVEHAQSEDLARLEEQAIQRAAASVADSIVQIQCVGGRRRVDGCLWGMDPVRD